MAAPLYNLILDFGGVLLNIDYHRPVQAFRELGLSDFYALYSQAEQNRLFDAFETGAISAAQFREELRQQTGLSLSDAQIDEAWNSMLLDLPARRIELLRKLRSRYRLFLLSNTNEIHVEAFERRIAAEYEPRLFDHLFEKHYYSCRIGVRKPHAEAFRYVLDTHGLKAEETLFVDDSVQHIRGASATGLRTLHLMPGEELGDALLREQLI